MQRLLAALAAFCFVSLAAAQDKPTIESFFRLSEYAAMHLSPDGQNIAALSPVGGKQNLVIVNVKTRKAKPITGLTDRDVVLAEWISGKRLIYYTGRLGERDVEQRGGGFFAVDMDGSSPRLIGEGQDESRTEGLRVTFRGLSLVRTLPNDSDDIIVEETIFSRGQQPQPGPLYRMDTRTGRKSDISLGKPAVGYSESWVADSKGVARAFVTQSPDEGTQIFYRPSADAPWKKLDEFNADTPNRAWRPLAVAEDNKTLYVTSRQGRDKSAIYRYAPETGKLGDLVAQHPRGDLTRLMSDLEDVRGVSYNAGEPGVAWFDDTLAKVQGVADKTFPDNVNLLEWSRDKSLVLIRSFSDALPGSFYLYDVKAGKMEWLADARPWIDPKKMSPMRIVRYPARDGLEITATLTIPKGSSGKNLPLVMVIHGGPWVGPDFWRWNPEVQFLASRGYVVMQPNYRGTLGFGLKHVTSSYMQWGLAMQDDITDGVKWAVDQGIVDPSRVCIYGGSYGGYAAMMGVAKTPEVFKCAVNYVGVTDLQLLMNASWSDTFRSDFARASYRRRIGDPDKDAQRLKETSPSELASRIKGNVLMAYGGADVRVVPEHGTRMRSAMERAGNKPEWIIVDDEGHGYRKLENQVMFYGAMERFLEKNIGK
ncbi:MAG: S9 family peptidase [Burkholderiales bacterium]|nr:S9 family peptidase [Burkholderiales bacterium]